MPIIKGIRRINPLNLNKNVTIGVAFPLDENNMFSGTETIEDQNRANLISILLTQPGERINQPNYGVGLKRKLFENNLDESTLLEDISNQTSFYMPEISLNSVKINQDIDEYKITIALDYSIADQASDSIQINFS